MPLRLPLLLQATTPPRCYVLTDIDLQRTRGAGCTPSCRRAQNTSEAMGDAPAGTSLLQSHADIDHRDHNPQQIQQQQHHHHHHKHRHLHNHRTLHHRQVDSIIATVSVTEEIIVDQNGSTQGTALIAASTTLDATVVVSAAASSAVPSSPSLVDTPLSTSTDIPITPNVFPVPVTDVLNTSTDLPVSPVLPLTTPTSANQSPSPGPNGLSGSHSSQSLSTSQATPLTSAPYLGTNSSSELSLIITPYHPRLTRCH